MLNVEKAWGYRGGGLQGVWRCRWVVVTAGWSPRAVVGARAGARPPGPMPVPRWPRASLTGQLSSNQPNGLQQQL